MYILVTQIGYDSELPTIQVICSSRVSIYESFPRFYSVLRAKFNLGKILLPLPAAGLATGLGTCLVIIHSVIRR